MLNRQFKSDVRVRCPSLYRVIGVDIASETHWARVFDRRVLRAKSVKTSAVRDIASFTALAILLSLQLFAHTFFTSVPDAQCQNCAAGNQHQYDPGSHMQIISGFR